MVKTGFEAYFYFSEEHPGDLAALCSTVCFDEGHLLVVGVDSGSRCDVYFYAGKGLRTLLTEEKLATIEEKTSRAGRSNDHAQNVTSDVRDSLSGLHRGNSIGSVMGILSFLFLLVMGPSSNMWSSPC